MSKNIHLRVASKLYFADNYRNIENLVNELSDILDDSISFVFAYDCEVEEKEKFTKDFLCKLKKEINRKIKC